MVVQIFDEDGKEITSTNVENKTKLENFIYYDFPSMLHSISTEENFRQNNISEYRIKKYYKAYGVEL